MKTNPTKAIRELCLLCMGGSPKEVRLCSSELCPLVPWRFGNPYYGKERPEGMPESQTNPVKVIGNFCKHHCSPEFPPDDCTEKSCPVYPFRNGKNPFRAKKTEAQVDAARDNMEKAVANRKKT